MNQPAPSLSVDPLGFKSIPAIEDYRGQYLLLLFFNMGCLTCKTRAIPIANNIVYNNPEMAVLGIHSTFGTTPVSDAALLLLIKDMEIAFPVVKDQQHRTWSAYKAGGTPHWVIVDKEGSIIKSIFGSMPNALQRLDLSIVELFQKKE